MAILETTLPHCKSKEPPVPGQDEGVEVGVCQIHERHPVILLDTLLQLLYCQLVKQPLGYMAIQAPQIQDRPHAFRLLGEQEVWETKTPFCVQRCHLHFGFPLSSEEISLNLHRKAPPERAHTHHILVG